MGRFLALLPNAPTYSFSSASESECCYGKSTRLRSRQNEYVGDVLTCDITCESREPFKSDGESDLMAWRTGGTVSVEALNGGLRQAG